MAEIHKNASDIHRRDQIATIIGQTTIGGFIAAGANRVRGVVSELGNPNAEFGEERNVVENVAVATGVLPTENNADFALGFCPKDIGCVMHLKDDVCVILERTQPPRHVAHCRLEAFPDAAGAIGRRDAACMHVLKNLSRKIGDDETVDDDGLLVK